MHGNLDNHGQWFIVRNGLKPFHGCRLGVRVASIAKVILHSEH